MFGTCSPLTFIVILQRFQMALIRSASQKGLTMLGIGCQENSPWKFPYAEEVNTCYIPDASLCQIILQWRVRPHGWRRGGLVQSPRAWVATAPRPYRSAGGRPLRG